MEKINALTSANIVADNIETLKQLFPTIVKEGNIDLNELKALLGENVEDKDEYYRFTWAGKSEARLEANKPTTATLRPNKKDSKDWENTGNIFIEGDNLEVLKLMQKSYANKIKMIYIDPPYNTGKDFVYKDNYTDNLGNYLEITGQVDESGKKLNTNTESDGRYHSNWLNMMYPRLRLARNLMTDDGVIFISIDDNEVHNLRKLCDEIFGEDNFVAIIPWRKRTTKTDVPSGVSQDYEWLICYKKKDFFAGMPVERKYYQTDDYPNDRWRLSDLTTQKTEDQRPNSAFDLVDPKTGKVYKYNPKRLWGITIDTFQDYYDRGKIVFPDDYDFLNGNIPSYRVFESEDKEKAILKYGTDTSLKSVSTVLPKEVGMNETGNKELFEILEKKIFDFPKPTELIKYLINFVVKKEFVILDFFSGSGTTAHAVMQLNAEDGGTRKCISVQLPEPTDEKSEAYKAKYFNIADITKERIRRAGEKIKNDYKDNKEVIDNLDVGFKAFKLDSSNITAWDGNPDNLEQQLDVFANNIKTNRTEEDILFEILLKYGLDLTVPIEEKNIVGKTVYSIGLGTLFICLADGITPQISEGIGAWKQELNPSICRAIFKDSGFASDKDKVNAMQILKRFGIEEVNSI